MRKHDGLEREGARGRRITVKDTLIHLECFQKIIGEKLQSDIRIGKPGIYERQDTFSVHVSLPSFQFLYVMLRNLIQQIFNHADTVVLKHDAVAVLRGIQVDVGHDAEVSVAIAIGENLVDMPDVVGFLCGFVDG